MTYGLRGASGHHRRLPSHTTSATTLNGIPSGLVTFETWGHYDRTHLLAVYVDGEQLVVGGEPVGWDLTEFVDEHAAMAREVVERADIVLIGDRLDPRFDR